MKLGGGMTYFKLFSKSCYKTYLVLKLKYHLLWPNYAFLWLLSEFIRYPKQIETPLSQTFADFLKICLKDYEEGLPFFIVPETY